MRQGSRGGFGIIGLFFSLLIVAVMVIIAISLYTRQGRVGQEDLDTPIQRARSVECEAQLRRVKMKVDLYRLDNDRYPESLEVLEDMPTTDLRCPVTGSPYEYDAVRGMVSCPDHIR